MGLIASECGAMRSLRVARPSSPRVACALQTIRAVEARAADMLGMKVAGVEPLQVPNTTACRPQPFAAR